MSKQGQNGKNKLCQVFVGVHHSDWGEYEDAGAWPVIVRVAKDYAGRHDGDEFSATREESPELVRFEVVERLIPELVRDVVRALSPLVEKHCSLGPIPDVIGIRIFRLAGVEFHVPTNVLDSIVEATS